MKRGADGAWITVGGVRVNARQQKELDASSNQREETIHRLFLVNPKAPVWNIEERECRIIVTGKVTWAEPLMPIKGSSRSQKRFMLGAFAFYTRKQAERKKLLLLAALMRAPAYGQSGRLHHEAFKQLAHHRETGEVK